MSPNARSTTIDPAAFVGTWVGAGEGTYPTTEPFTYLETVTFAAVAGKPFLTYTQRTSHPDTGAPMHAEVGYLRLNLPGSEGNGSIAELVIAQPTGITECHSGTVTFANDTLVVRLATTSVGRTPTAKDVTSVRRELRVAGDVLDYELWMAAVGKPDTLHLRAELRRQHEG